MNRPDYHSSLNSLDPNPRLILHNAKHHLCARIMEPGDVHAWWLMDDKQAELLGCVYTIPSIYVHGATL